MIGIQTKLIAALGAVILLGLALLGFARHFEAKGHAAADKEWLAKMASVRAAYVQKDAANQLNYQRIERKTSEEHETELAALRRDRDVDRRRADAAGGLRIPASACPASRPAATPEAAGAQRTDEASAATVRLPAQVENDLWALTDDADQLSAQLRALQAWVRANGFYGPETEQTPQLLDRMIAAKNSDPEAAK